MGALSWGCSVTPDSRMDGERLQDSAVLQSNTANLLTTGTNSTLHPLSGSIQLELINLSA
ncbi:hypothetical protein ACVWYZ_002459 [Thermostichus sp. MS-CIW-37]